MAFLKLMTSPEKFHASRRVTPHAWQQGQALLDLENVIRADLVAKLLVRGMVAGENAGFFVKVVNDLWRHGMKYSNFCYIIK